MTLIGAGLGVGQERSGFLGRGRDTRQVEGQPTQQAITGSLGRGLDALGGELGLNVAVDGIATLGDGGDLARIDRGVRPMRLVDSALGHPATEKVLLSRGQGLVRLGRRHDVVLVVAKDTRDDFAFLRLARDDGGIAAIASLQCLLTDVQAQATLAGIGVEAMAMETDIG